MKKPKTFKTIAEQFRDLQELRVKVHQAERAAALKSEIDTKPKGHNRNQRTPNSRGRSTLNNS
jgi:hypothetical protein